MTSKRFRPSGSSGWNEAKHPRGPGGKFSSGSGGRTGQAKGKLPGLGLAGSAKPEPGREIPSGRELGVGVDALASSKGRQAAVAKRVAAAQWEAIYDRESAKSSKVAEKLSTRGASKPKSPLGGTGLSTTPGRKIPTAGDRARARSGAVIGSTNPKSTRGSDSSGMAQFRAQQANPRGSRIASRSTRGATPRAPLNKGGKGGPFDVAKPARRDPNTMSNAELLADPDVRKSLTPADIKALEAGRGDPRARERVPSNSPPRNAAEQEQVRARVERPYAISGLPAGVTINRHQEGIDAIRKGGNIVGQIEVEPGGLFYVTVGSKLSRAGKGRLGPFKSRKEAALAALRSSPSLPGKATGE